MVDFRRLRGLLVPLALLGGMLGAFSVPLILTFGREPLRFVGSDRMTFTLVSYEMAGGRVSGALAQAPDRRGRFGMLLGASTLECAVDPVSLGSRGTIPRRWLSLFGRGSTVVDLEGMADFGFVEGLRPELLVLTLDPGMWAETGGHLDKARNDLFFDHNSLLTHLAARRWRAIASDARAIFLTIPNSIFPCRTRANDRFQYVTLLARNALLRGIGQGTHAIYNPAPDPWNSNAAWAEGHLASEAFLREQLAGYRRRRWFDREAYSPTGANLKSLVRLIISARKKGIEVAVVLLPETGWVRELVPHEALGCLRQALRSVFAEDAPEVVDLRAALPDALFYDLTHLNQEGKQVFTRRLSEALEERFGAGSRREPALVSTSGRVAIGRKFEPGIGD